MTRQAKPPTDPAFLVDPQARQKWVQRYVDEAVPPPPHPAPVVTARAARPEELIQTANTLAKLLRSRGFRAELVYSRGTRLGARGQPLGGPVDVLTIRALRVEPTPELAGAGPVEQVVVLWHNRNVQYAWWWRVGQWPASGRMSITELTEALQQEPAR